MKKFILVASVAIFGVLVMTSCKKEYTCDCTFDPGVTLGSDMKAFSLGKTTKKKAKETCETAEKTWALVGAKCTVK